MYNPYKAIGSDFFMGPQTYPSYFEEQVMEKQTSNLKLAVCRDIQGMENEMQTTVSFRVKGLKANTYLTPWVLDLTRPCPKHGIGARFAGFAVPKLPENVQYKKFEPI